MIDLHMHTFLSDGDLLPSELVQRCIAAGYSAMAITDHADQSNLKFLVESANKIAGEFNSTLASPICIVPGVELTHVRPSAIRDLIEEARMLGARLIVVHGETVVEPVPKGTNRAAIEGGADILAHPGLITREEVELARDKGVALELTTRKMHGMTNGHVAGLAREAGAILVVNTDSHSPGDLMTPHMREHVILGAGLDADYLKKTAENSRLLVNRLMGKILG
ncbi:MAG: histidinol phosphate phosphatase domain-containing protein [Candidatus Abyssobacteria bacterium SURF_5]|uniref:Histidinol phosphate phosphatase domain-containing protein n=1 Tax=Abyssobacteria bacterium (strain SURF_5) TaxID=2093360 RepID=A0A3A4NP94_ABYX5|nr:MAG: histidinol phosphate phosphatase domain-containing protein [Candidatus Abyssubacteria bacterium SURF_5]